MIPSKSDRPVSPALSKLRGNRGLLLGICLASNVFAGFVATVMAAYLPDAVAELAGSGDSATVGLVGAYIGSLFLVGWAFGGISFGLLADRLGRARTFVAAVTLFGAATVAASFSPSWPVLVACRLIGGVGIGGTMVVSAILVAEAFAERARAIALGFIGVSYPIGIITAGAVSYSIADWRAGLLVGVAPLVLGIAGAFVIRDGEHWMSQRSAQPARTSEFGTLLSPAHRSDFLLGATIFGAMSVGLWATFSWLPAWAESLMASGEGGQQARGILMMVLGSGGIVGGGLSGFLANRFGRRGTLLFSFAGAFAASLVLFQANTTFSNAVFLQTAVLALFFGISQGTLTVYIPELFPTGVRATATGVCFNMGRLVTSGAVFFVGVLVPVLGGYGTSLSVFSMMYLLGFGATLLGRETGRTAPAAPGPLERPAISPVPAAALAVAEVRADDSSGT